ncbi:DUF305 domain-containing protein [Deinococcus saxicola]|uniref:DUF305 domain-containing protein n=1 Tax=Deinococcus saxicola TaxID=249406 RepID=UPI0039EEA0B0
MKKTVLIALSTATLGTLAFAQVNPSPMAMGGSMSSMAQSTAGGGMGMMGMNQMMGGLATLSGKSFDRAFLSMMVPHHQAAIQMSTTILTTTRDPQIQTWANAIIRAQQTEIAQMNALLRGYGGANMRMANGMTAMKGDMGMTMSTGADKDRAFVQAMIPHHGSAIMMADLALMRSQEPVILKLAQGIVTAQAQEMYDFQLYLRQ